jgi:hypothetical protein
MCLGRESCIGTKFFYWCSIITFQHVSLAVILYLLSLNTQWYVQGSGKGRHWTKLLSCDEVGFMRILNRDENHVIHHNIVLAKNKICLIIILFRSSLKNVLLNYIVYLTEWVNNFIAVSMTTIRWWYCQRNMLKCYNATSIEEFCTYTWL